LAFAWHEDLTLDYPSYFPEPTYDFLHNPLKKETIKLGQALFYDPIMSLDSTISCESCHSPFNAFGHTDHDLSHGINDSIGIRNAPTIFNQAWATSFMWDGAANHIETQALIPIESRSEMGNSLANVVHKLNQSHLYKELFYNSYGDSTATGERILKALAQFQLTLISGNAKYDKMIRGEVAFSVQEERGYALFKTHCESCHQEPLFTSGDFENNGLPIDTTLNDIGRMKVTKISEDSLKFKVPTLRNISYSYPYMHDGRFYKLSEVLNHYRVGIQPSATLADQLKPPLDITKNECIDIIAFLLTLKDEEFVFNSNNKYPFDIFKE